MERPTKEYDSSNNLKNIYILREKGKKDIFNTIKGTNTGNNIPDEITKFFLYIPEFYGLKKLTSWNIGLFYG